MTIKWKLKSSSRIISRFDEIERYWEIEMRRIHAGRSRMQYTQHLAIAFGIQSYQIQFNLNKVEGKESEISKVKKKLKVGN